jgi:hypothetical protein
MPLGRIYTRCMRDLGAKIAFMALREGTPVYDAQDKRVGVVEEVLADDQAAIFEGILIHTLPLPGRHVVADVDQISALHEQGVVLSVDGPTLRRAKGAKPTPSGDSTQHPLERPLQARLRRLWDRIRSRAR